MARARGAGPVVIATDGSDSAEQAVVEGARVASTLGTKAVLAYVRPTIGSLGEPYYQERLSEQLGFARAALDRAQALVREEECEAEEEILEGAAAEQIVELARVRDAPLIVVGSRGHGAVAGALLGSVSSAIIHRSDRPVLVVPRSLTKEKLGCRAPCTGYHDLGGGRGGDTDDAEPGFKRVRRSAAARRRRRRRREREFTTGARPERPGRGVGHPRDHARAARPAAVVASDTDRARHHADARLETVLGQFEEMDLPAAGQVGDETPLTALDDAVRSFAPDHILIALRSSQEADWQERGLLDRVRRRFELPLTVFVVPDE